MTKKKKINHPASTLVPLPSKISSSPAAVKVKVGPSDLLEAQDVGVKAAGRVDVLGGQADVLQAADGERPRPLCRRGGHSFLLFSSQIWASASRTRGQR